MPLKRTIRRVLRRLAQLYSDAAQAHAAHGRVPRRQLRLVLSTKRAE